MQQQKRNSIIKICAFDFAFLILAILSIWYINRNQTGYNFIYLGLSAVLILLILLSPFIYKDTFGESKVSPVIAFTGFALSLVLMLVINNPLIIPFWIVGSLLAAAMADAGLGLFFGYFMLIQMSCLKEVDTISYILYLLAMSFSCYKLRRIKSFKDIVYTDCIVSCLILFIYIVGSLTRANVIEESGLLFIILTFIILITFSGLMKLSFKNILNKNTEENSEVPDNASGFAYLNDMADDLSRMEQLDNQVQNSLEAILDAEINDLQVSDVEPITDYQAPAGLSPIREPEVDYISLIADCSELLQALKASNKHAYIQSMRVAALAEDGAKAVNANHSFTKAIGTLYQADLSGLDTPEKLDAAIFEANRALDIAGHKDFEGDRSVLSSKEAAIVYITHQLARVFFFLKASKSPINPEKIVDKSMSADMLNGTLNNSGLSLKDCSELRRYFIDRLSSLM